MDWVDKIELDMKFDDLQEQINKLINHYDIKIKNLEWEISSLKKRIKKIENDKTLVRKVHTKRVRK